MKTAAKVAPQSSSASPTKAAPVSRPAKTVAPKVAQPAAVAKPKAVQAARANPAPAGVATRWVKPAGSEVIAKTAAPAPATPAAKRPAARKA